MTTSTELSIRSELVKSDSGSIFVSHHDLTRLSYHEIKSDLEMLNYLVAANPEYEFCVQDELFALGITIKWRKST